MRYNPKSMGMLNRDMLKRDLFFFLILIIPADIAISRMDPSFGGYATMRLFAIIMTSVIVIALVLFLIITNPKRLIPDELLDKAEAFEMYLPDDITYRETRDHLPGFDKDTRYTCAKEDPDLTFQLQLLCCRLMDTKELKGARSTIEPDYPRFNIIVRTADGEQLIETFHENITYGGTIYRVRQKDLDALFFNEEFPTLFNAETVKPEE